MAPALISLRGITKTYQSAGREVHALRGIDLDLGTGEALCVVGRSGSGKTTLLDIIATLTRPSGGTYHLSGADIASAGERELARIRNRRFGFVFQSFHLLGGLNVLQNVCLPARYRGGKDLKPAARHWLEALGINDLGERLPSELSGGQQQRVAIARALVTDPDVLLADEPTGNLDTQTGEEVVRLLLDLGRRDRSLILVTHDRELAGRFDRRIELADGLVVTA